MFWLTGNLPTNKTWWVFPFPNEEWLLAVLNNVLRQAAQSQNWLEEGTATPLDATFQFYSMMDGIKIMPIAPATVVDFVGAALPDGFLWCNGDTYNRVDYPELYANIASIFIVDADTFVVPDYRENFALGGSFTNVGETGGVANVTLTEAQMPSHYHLIPGYIEPVVVAPGELPVYAPDLLSTNTGSAGGDESHTNIPPYVRAPKIIYTGKF